MDEQELDQVLAVGRAGVHLAVLVTAAALLVLWLIGVVWPAAWWLMPALAVWWVASRAWKLGTHRKQVAGLMAAARRQGASLDERLDHIERAVRRAE